MYKLPETELLSISEVRGDERNKTFVIEPLLPGYGVTLANALRRVLLSSLEGDSLTSITIEGASHEFTTIPSVKEDVLDIILNLKALRVKMYGTDPATITLDVKGPAKVTAKNFTRNPSVDLVNADAYIATLEKGGHLKISAVVEHGRGFVPTESRERGKEALGTIYLDASFSPVKKVSFTVENTRVGRMTNFDKITMEITTDGTIDPANALDQAAQILVEHFARIAQFARGEPITIEEPITTTLASDKKEVKKLIKKKQLRPKKHIKSSPKIIKVKKNRKSR